MRRLFSHGKSGSSASSSDPSLSKSSSFSFGKSSPFKSKGSMSVSMRDLDPSFQGSGQKAGVEIWRIENFKPVPVPKSLHGKFFMGDSYVILKTTSLKSGALKHDIHYWIGKDTSQDEAGTAAVKTVELDAALGGRAVQYREVQGCETEKFLSYFKPCIIPQEGGAASGFKHVEEKEYETRLFVCKGKHVVHVNEVKFARSSLNHDDVFILDTKSKIFQFNGSSSSIQERAKALEVVQYIKDAYHDGKCEIASVEDGKLMSDPESGEFWGFFGGFAPLPRKTVIQEEKATGSLPTRLLCVEKGRSIPVQASSLSRDVLKTGKCYVLDCGMEVFVWMGRSTSLDERKAASSVAEEVIAGPERPKAHIVRVIEGFETVMFRSKFDSWPTTTEVTASEDGRGKVAALLKRQGLNVKGLMKAAPVKEEQQAYIDLTGKLQVWRVNGRNKALLTQNEHSKFFSGDCYVFQYTYSRVDQEEYLIGAWIGKQSVEEEETAATSIMNKMADALKGQAVQVRIYEGKEPFLFFSIFQSYIVFKGGISSGYKSYVSEKGISNGTYSADGVALFRVQGSGPDNMQSIQVEPVAASLNSSYCYILHSGSTVFTWSGSFTTPEDQEIVERQLDVIKPNCQPKPQREGSETEQFWTLLGGKAEYSSQKIPKDAESDPHLFSCEFSKGILKITEIFNFNQDDLMTEDTFILDCHTDIFVWVGQQVDLKNKIQSLSIGKKFVEQDFLLEKLSRDTPIYIIAEGSEPSFFTRFFTWDSTKSVMQGNSFERKLATLKNGATPTVDKPKRRPPAAAFSGRSSAPDKSQRSRNVSFSPERVRVRGRSPAFNALASKFENPSTRNLSTPPIVRKLYPKSVTPDSVKVPATRTAAIAALTGSYDTGKENIISRSFKVGSPTSPATPPKIPIPDASRQIGTGSMTSRIEPLTVQEDIKEGVGDDDGLPTFPYERLKISSPEPVTDIDVTKRETYLSSEEFREKFGMTKEAFYKLPKWRQNKLKMALHLF